MQNASLSKTKTISVPKVFFWNHLDEKFKIEPNKAWTEGSGLPYNYYVFSGSITSGNPDLQKVWQPWFFSYFFLGNPEVENFKIFPKPENFKKPVWQSWSWKFLNWSHRTTWLRLVTTFRFKAIYCISRQKRVSVWFYNQGTKRPMETQVSLKE